MTSHERLPWVGGAEYNVWKRCTHCGWLVPPGTLAPQDHDCGHSVCEEHAPLLRHPLDLLSPEARERLRVELESLDRHQRASTASALSERMP